MYTINNTIRERKYSELEFVGEKKYSILHTKLLTVYIADKSIGGREYSIL